MDALDGNAIGGSLADYFGTEMTAKTGRCVHCGASARIAELCVYLRAPGIVVRCRQCGQVVIVIIELRSRLQVDMSYFTLAELVPEAITPGCAKSGPE